MNELTHRELGDAIRKMAWAYLLLHLNLNLGSLNLLPNWLGYWMLLSSMVRLAQWSPTARLLRPLGGFLAIMAGLDWLAALAGVSTPANGLWPLLLALLTLLRQLIGLYFHFQLLTDIADAAVRAGYEEPESILRARTGYTLLTTGIYLLQGYAQQILWIYGLLLVAGLLAAFLICRQLFRLNGWLREPLPPPEEL